MSVFDFSAQTIGGDTRALSEYQGSALLIVNTASKCGFTPQYEGLENLHKSFEGKGLRVLGFPCNQFGGQEPEGNEQVAEFCQINYGVSFPMFAKVDVNGDDAHPLFQWLTSQAPGVLGSEKIKWNFTKFLVAKNGVDVERYASTTKPDSLRDDIDKVLKA